MRGREGRCLDETVLNVAPRPVSHYAAVNSCSLHDKAPLGNFLPPPHPPDRGTCLNTRHMIWISVIHAEINRPDELFGTLSPTTLRRIFSLQPPPFLQKKKIIINASANWDLGLKSLQGRKTTTKRGKSYLSFPSNFEISSDENNPDLLQSFKLFRKLLISTVSCFAIIISLWCCLVKFARVPWP